MELIYLHYRENLMSLKEINFSSNLSFEVGIFDFTITRIKNYQEPQNFFDPKISGIKAFVGKNGIGKTTSICKPIMASNWLMYEFIVFKRDNQLLIFVHPFHKDKIIQNETDIEHKMIVISDRIPGDEYLEVNSKSNPEFDDLHRIYYSSSFTDSVFNTRSILDDISTSGLLMMEIQKINSEKKNSKDFTNESIIRHKHQELVRKINFLDSDVGKSFTKAMAMNPKLNISHFQSEIQYIPNQFSGIELFDKLESEYREKIVKHGLLDISSLSHAPRIALILYSIVCNMPNNIRLEYIEFLKREQFSFYGSNLVLSSKDVNLSGFLTPIIDLLNHNMEFIEDHYILYRNGQLHYAQQSFSIPLELGHEFIDYYHRWFNRDNKIYKYLFSWNISSGEYSYLSLFSRLYDHRFNLSQGYFIIVIDEGDANFHPEWSRRHIEMLNLWIPKIFARAKSIQLILTTHSPYVLSDLPSSNVFLLTKENGILEAKNTDNQTFGANIHDLLANEFFLEDGFIGAFAKKKIQDVIDNLQLDKKFQPSNKMEKGEIKSVIDIIGEPFLKDKLLDMYQRKFNDPDFYDQQIEKMELKIEEYKKLKNKKG